MKDLRSQYRIVEPHNKGELVRCYCPKCEKYLGSWPQGGYVPAHIWTGAVVCPECGWEPENVYITEWLNY